MIFKHSDNNIPYLLKCGQWVMHHSLFCCFTCQGLHSRSPTVVSPNEEAVRPPAEEGNALNRGSQLETRNTHEHDPLADQDILESIEPEFFDSEGFDPCNHELKASMLVFYMNLSI